MHERPENICRIDFRCSPILINIGENYSARCDMRRIHAYKLLSRLWYTQMCYLTFHNDTICTSESYKLYQLRWYIGIFERHILSCLRALQNYCDLINVWKTLRLIQFLSIIPCVCVVHSPVYRSYLKSTPQKLYLINIGHFWHFE